MNEKILKILKIYKLYKDSLSDVNLGPMAYKNLKEHGYTPEKWKNMSKEQYKSLSAQWKSKENLSEKEKSFEEKGSFGTKNQSGLSRIKVSKYKGEYDKNGKFVPRTILTGRTKSGKLYQGKHTNDLKNGYNKPKFGQEEMSYDASIKGTLYENTDDKGNFLPERQAIHMQYFDRILEGKEKPKPNEKLYTFMGGGPGAGKSHYRKNSMNLDEKTTIPIDPDDIKGVLPEYAPKNPGRVHEESSAVAKQLRGIAIDNGYSIMDDGTGDGSVESMVKKIKAAKDAGYKVVATYVTTPIEQALKNNKTRTRSVDENMLVNTHKKISGILPQIASLFDEVVLVHNPGHGKGEPFVIAKGGSGKGLKPEKKYKKYYNDFLELKDK